MSDTEEDRLLEPTEEEEDHSTSIPDLELGDGVSKPSLTKSRRLKASKSVELSRTKDKTCLFVCCSSQWWLFVLVSLVALLYLFTNIEVSFMNHKRWMPSVVSHRYLNGVNQTDNIAQKYDRQFNDQVLTPFKTLLARVRTSLNYEGREPSRGLMQNIPNISSILPVRVQLDDSQTMALVDSESNLAALYYDRWKQPGFGKNAVKHSTVKYCADVKMISPHLVRQNNLFWQVVTNTKPDMTVYLYNAYYDSRLPGKPAVKIISVTDRQVQIEKKQWWCLLWFDQLRDPVLSKVTEVYTVWPEYWDFGVKDGIYGPQVITCAVPLEYSGQVPQAISIQTTDNCDKLDRQPGNVLRVIHNLPQAKPNTALVPNRPSIGVCVQAFRFGSYDVSVRLVEWLEMVRLLGADKVYFYVYGATENMMKVLRHYQKQGLVDFRRLTLPGEQVNVNSMYNYYYSQLGGKFWPQELIELNDCLYRNIHRHQFVGIFDIDEVIMPQTAQNWHELIANIETDLTPAERKTKAYYLNRHAYVYEMFEETKLDPSGAPIPDWLYTMRHTYRAELLGSGENIKCLHRTDLVSAVHNHFPMRCLNTTFGHHTCDGLVIDPKHSILMHYRRNRSPPPDCKTPETPIKCTIHDRTAWRWFDTLAQQVRPQLYAIFGNDRSP